MATAQDLMEASNQNIIEQDSDESAPDTNIEQSGTATAEQSSDEESVSNTNIEQFDATSAEKSLDKSISDSNIEHLDATTTEQSFNESDFTDLRTTDELLEHPAKVILSYIEPYSIVEKFNTFETELSDVIKEQSTSLPTGLLSNEISSSDKASTQLTKIPTQGATDSDSNAKELIGERHRHSIPVPVPILNGLLGLLKDAQTKSGLSSPDNDERLSSSSSGSDEEADDEVFTAMWKKYQDNETWRKLKNIMQLDRMGERAEKRKKYKELGRLYEASRPVLTPTYLEAAREQEKQARNKESKQVQFEKEVVRLLKIWYKETRTEAKKTGKKHKGMLGFKQRVQEFTAYISTLPDERATKSTEMINQAMDYAKWNLAESALVGLGLNEEEVLRKLKDIWDVAMEKVDLYDLQNLSIEDFERKVRIVVAEWGLEDEESEEIVAAMMETRISKSKKTGETAIEDDETRKVSIKGKEKAKIQ